jgi:fatty acid desaturase
VHHLWPSIPWYQYEAAYHEMKPLLDSKGSPQCLGILDSKEDFFGFVYDALIGIHIHKKETAESDQAVLEEAVPAPTLEAVKESIVVPISKSLDRKAS